MNKVMLIGNLTADPESRTFSGDSTVCHFSIAINRFSRNGDNQADFIRITTFGQTAENCAKYLLKGSKVAVEGRLQTSTYDKDGQKRTSMDVIGERIEFLTRASDSDNNGASTTKVAKPKVKDLVSVETDDQLPF